MKKYVAGDQTAIAGLGSSLRGNPVKKISVTRCRSDRFILRHSQLDCHEGLTTQTTRPIL